MSFKFFRLDSAHRAFARKALSFLFGAQRNYGHQERHGDDLESCQCPGAPEFSGKRQWPKEESSLMTERAQSLPRVTAITAGVCPKKRYCYVDSNAANLCFNHPLVSN